MKGLILCLFLLTATAGSFDIMDGIAKVSNSENLDSYIRPIVFTAPTNGLAWGFGIRKNI